MDKNEECEEFKATTKCVAGLDAEMSGAGGRHRQSVGRDAFDTKNNHPCRKVIAAEWSGWCHCGGGKESGGQNGGGAGPAFNCTHAPFTCLDECRTYHKARRDAVKADEARRAEKRRAKIAQAEATPIIAMPEAEPPAEKAKAAPNGTAEEAAGAEAEKKGDEEGAKVMKKNPASIVLSREELEEL